MTKAMYRRGTRVHNGKGETWGLEQKAKRSHLSPQTGNRESKLGKAPDFETSQLMPSDTPPPPRTHFLNVPKQFHQLEMNIQMSQTMGNIYHVNYHRK